MREIKLFSRHGCHLCEIAKSEMERISAESGIEISIEEIFIDGNDSLESEYGLMVPVIHIDGVMHGFGRIEATRFKSAISSQGS